jgi:isocitrate/isopropylmalate dehydrogenase
VASCHDKRKRDRRARNVTLGGSPVYVLRLERGQPGDIDFVVVRENTEGEYSSIGGRLDEGTEDLVF